MREKLLTRGGVYILRDFQKGHKVDKKWPPTIFFSNLLHQWTSFYHFRKKNKKKILYCARECKGKDVQIIINLRYYFTDTRKKLWNCCNIYESAVSITCPLKTIADPLKEIKMVKTDPKKVPSQIFFLIVPLGTFYEKKMFHFTIPLNYTVKK